MAKNRKYDVLDYKDHLEQVVHDLDGSRNPILYGTRIWAKFQWWLIDYLERKSN